MIFKNKKAAGPIGIVMAVLLVIIFLIFFVGGGTSILFNITKTLRSIPTIVWVILGIIILFRMLKK